VRLRGRLVTALKDQSSDEDDQQNSQEYSDPRKSMGFHWFSFASSKPDLKGTSVVVLVHFSNSTIRTRRQGRVNEANATSE
jgi:hypothetical protein